MTDRDPASFDSPEPAVSAQAGGSTVDARPPNPLTVRRGILALLIMYGCQTLVGVAFAYGVKLFGGGDQGAASVDIQMVGMTSVLVGGALVLVWVWTDIRKRSASFKHQIGLRPTAIPAHHGALLVALLLGGTHLLAWVYRSLLLPLVGHGGVIGGGSQMFAHIQETGSVPGMAAFLTLALFVGPVMEEVVFRGYLQSALTSRFPTWIAILLTSLVFMAGHGPMVLWPMYLLYSIAWGWLFVRTGSLRASIALHSLSNLFYTVVGFMGWEILA